MKISGLLTLLGGTNSKLINISGLDIETSNYILPINIHKGIKRFDAVQPNDIYLDNNSTNDFSNVKFYDLDGTLLESYISNYGNYEIYPDSTIGTINIITTDGIIISSGRLENPGYVSYSSDNGKTWIDIITEGSNKLSFLDSSDNLFVFNTTDEKLYKSSNWKSDNTWAEVLDLSGFTSPLVGTANTTEDSNGHLYISTYQNEFYPLIYKSIDNGDNWTDIFSPASCKAWVAETVYTVGEIVRPPTVNNKLYYCTVAGISGSSEPTFPTTSGGTVEDGGVTWKESQMQHGHLTKVDPYTDNIYVGWDGSNHHIMKSEDGGITWNIIYSNSRGGDVVSVIFEENKRFFGGGWGGLTDATGILKTEDDITFTKSFEASHTIQGLKKLGSGYYGASVAERQQMYPQIIYSNDEGDSWKTILIQERDVSHSFIGDTFMLNTGTPTGETEEQLLVGSYNYLTDYKHKRIFDGGNHYQASFYVKIPVLPTTGKTIRIVYQGTATRTSSIFSKYVSNNLMHRWKINEGTGTNIVDSVGSLAGILTAGTGSWGTVGARHAGATLPAISNTDHSFNFNQDGIIAITNSSDNTDFNINLGRTIIAWVKVPYQTISGYRFIFEKGAFSTNYYALGINAVGNLSFWTRVSTRTTFSTNIANCYLLDNQCHMVGICMNADTTDKLTFVFDGIKGDPYSITPYIWDTSYNFNIGGSASADNRIKGIISDVQIYDADLSAAEILRLYEDRPIGEVTLT